jgi:hypothetical protein
MLRMKENRVKFYFIEGVLANFREGGVSNSVTAIYESNLIKYQHKKISFFLFILSSIFLFTKNVFKKTNKIFFTNLFFVLFFISFDNSVT